MNGSKSSNRVELIVLEERQFSLTYNFRTYIIFGEWNTWFSTT